MVRKQEVVKWDENYTQKYCLDLIRSIYDPEHPNTLEELRVVSAPQVLVGHNRVKVEFTPTVPHCGMSTLIGGHSELLRNTLVY